MTPKFAPEVIIVRKWVSKEKNRNKKVDQLNTQFARSLLNCQTIVFTHRQKVYALKQNFNNVAALAHSRMDRWPIGSQMSLDRHLIGYNVNTY